MTVAKRETYCSLLFVLTFIGVTPAPLLLALETLPTPAALSRTVSLLRHDSAPELSVEPWRFPLPRSVMLTCARLRHASSHVLEWSPDPSIQSGRQHNRIACDMCECVDPASC